MKNLIPIVILYVASTSISLAQVNRYTQPPPTAKYNPMTMEELRYTPELKSAKANENFKKLELLFSELQSFVEINGYDGLLEKELTNWSNSFDKVMKKDITTIDADIIKYNTLLKKHFRDYEIRLKNGSLSTGEKLKKEFYETRKGFSVLKSPSLDSTVLGTSGTMVFVEERVGEFYKIKFKGQIGYIYHEAVIL